jgi:hypothetical protein
MIPMRQLNVLAATLGVAVASLSCGSVVRNGSSPMFLVINTLQGAAGTTTGGVGTLGTPLVSNVLLTVTTSPPCPPVTPPATTVSCALVVSDVGQVVLTLVAKNLSTNTAGPSSPSTNNEVTITRYHVAYTRGDCDPNCKPGVDVPYPFDGAVTGTIQVGGSLTLGFELVRIVAKQEPPLAALASTTNVLTTIASVTFYGQDLVGNAIQATGTIQVDFGTFGFGG